MDHYHRFHFRFIDPNLDLLEQGRVGQVWDKIGDQFVREFAGRAKRLVEKEFSGWNLYLLFFARGGFSAAARTEAKREGIELVELQQLES